MSATQTKRRNQVRLARLEIIAPLYKRGYSMRQIRTEVMDRLGIEKYSLQTVHSDIHVLLKEWRESRIEDIDEAVQLELTRIDDAVKELWEQWEKSKEDYDKTTRTSSGIPQNRNAGDYRQDSGITTTSVSKTTTNVVGLGNPSYIYEIRQQLIERRKLLGLYAPEKKDISGGVSFTSYLIESGLIDDENATEDKQ